MDADFYFKIDDDVGVNVRALAEYLAERRSQGNLYLVRWGRWAGEVYGLRTGGRAMCGFVWEQGSMWIRKGGQGQHG